MRKKDVILIIVVLIISFIFIGINNIRNSKTIDTVEIYVNNKLYRSIPINKKEEIKIQKGKDYNIVKVHDKGVEMLDSSCPDKVCVHTGFIDKPSKSIVCIPNKVNIKMKTKDTNNQKEDVVVN
ncbi:NusG domain II-containing protein [Romboutsia sp.]|uniref:NusG domain II-containing protein n=1 Tax=Romboutsia sp. TaxID=1965302 RepID=UPI003F409B1E